MTAPRRADDLLRGSDVELPVGLATGIGSLPHVDPDDAVELVLRHMPRLPFVPTLPARSPRETMLGQAVAGVAGVHIADDGSLEVDHRALDPEAPLGDRDFTTDAWAGLRAFLCALSDREGAVKLQLTGPVTFGIALHLAGVDADLAFRVAGAAVRARAHALLALLEARLPQAQALVMVDEPGLSGLVTPGYPITVDVAVDLVSETLAILETGAVTGLHCCERSDWGLVLGTGPQVLSVPLDAGLLDVAGTLAAFLDRGGWVAWGAVPTGGPVGESADILWRRLAGAWCDLVRGGCDPVRLRTQAIVTPDCGLATHGPTQAEQVLELAVELAHRTGQQAVGVKLSVGA